MHTNETNRQDLSGNQRMLVSLLAVESMQTGLPIKVAYNDSAKGWTAAIGFISSLSAKEPTAKDKVYVCDDNNENLLTISLPWREIRAVRALAPSFEGDCLRQTLRLYRCRDYLSGRDLFTNEPKFWFEDTELVMEITTGGFFSEQVRNFVARFPEESNMPLGDLSRND